MRDKLISTMTPSPGCPFALSVCSVKHLHEFGIYPSRPFSNLVGVCVCVKIQCFSFLLNFAGHISSLVMCLSPPPHECLYSSPRVSLILVAS